MTDSTKHTIAGILGAFLAIIGPLSVLLASLQAIFATIPGHAPADYTFAIVGAVLTFLAASARIWIGIITGTSDPAASVNVTGKIGVILLVAALLGGVGASAQALPQLTNIYAAGASYAPGAVPSTAGTAIYAHLISPVSSTYAFTVLDLLPNTLKPLSVTTNIGAGVAQKIATFGNAGIYIPTAAGVSVNGSNTGWNWNTGGLADIPIGTKGWGIEPAVRVEKSSVSGGAGYQVITGFYVRWGTAQTPAQAANTQAKRLAKAQSLYLRGK